MLVFVALAIALALVTAAATFGFFAGFFTRNYGQHADAGAGSLTVWHLASRITSEYFAEWEKEHYGRHALLSNRLPGAA